MNCRQAETIAARDRNARVIYGEDAYAYRYGNGDPGTWSRDDDWRTGRDRDPRLRCRHLRSRADAGV